MKDLDVVLSSLSLDPVPEIEASHASSNPLDVYRCYLAGILANVAKCEPEIAHKSIQWPNNIFNGDLAVILPKLRAGVKAEELAVELMKNFPPDHPLFLLPLLEGVHLRVFFRPESLARLLLPWIQGAKREFGHVKLSASTEADPKKVLIEFSSPNITSEFQGKHLRSTIIGAFVGKLYESMGWDVTRITYLGDWGKPIALLYVGWEKYGSEEAYKADPVSHLLEVYHKIEEDFKPEQAASKQARDDLAKEGKDEGEAQVEIESKGIFAARNEAFKRLEEGDEEMVSFWTRVRDINIDNYGKFYERLGVRFDEYSGESQVTSVVMTEIEEMLKAKGLSEESGGAWIVHMQKLGARAGTAIIRDRSGSSTYLLRDLAAVLERSRQYSFDKMIYVVASDNSVHFTQLFKILEALGLGDLAKKLQHVKFSEVSKMFATLGKGYKPQLILDECKKAIATLPETEPEKMALMGNSDQVIETIATSALLVQELSTRSASVHAFHTAALPSFKLGSGPDLQYWLMKLHYRMQGVTATVDLTDEDYEALADDDQANLLRVLAQYPEVVKTTYHSLEPSGIVTYLATVTEQLAECLNDDDEDDNQKSKEENGGNNAVENMAPGLAALFDATRIVLENGMELLGLVPLSHFPPERADTPLAG
ncbi:hypothetical protein J1614_012095 [Plenodomus biglobosus]|nr:hypothetical protein J1614_012095 [Plenodomus biglobosus]